MKKIKILSMFGLMLLLAFSSLAQKQQEWTMLFNGKNLRDWKKLNGEAEFFVENGMITGVSKIGTPNTFLATNKTFTNFILEYDMKMDEGLNSGVQIRSHSIPSYNNGRVHGMQVECEDSKRGWAGGLYDEARNGWRYPLEYNPSAKNAYKKEDWNTFKVLAWNNHIITWINGVPIANLVEEEVETGFIALQVHSIRNDALEGKKIQWRNIRIKNATEMDFQQLRNVNIPEVSYLKNQLTESERKQGWQLLWDGASTDNWRGARLTTFPQKGWSVNNGDLVVQKSGGGESAHGGDIVTKKKYRNFILDVDFKMTERANSGIKYFVDTELNQGKGSSIGCEYQILDDARHPDAKQGVNGNRTVGSLYDLIKANGKEYNPHLPNEKYVNAIGRWNRARIVVNGNKVEHYLNGIKIVEYERGTQMWRALVAFSKFKDWPNFGENQEGNILLQDHGDEVAFRNIKIKEL
jgi:hypothetical protein